MGNAIPDHLVLSCHLLCVRKQLEFLLGTWTMFLSLSWIYNINCSKVSHQHAHLLAGHREGQGLEQESGSCKDWRRARGPSIPTSTQFPTVKPHWIGHKQETHFHDAKLLRFASEFFNSGLAAAAKDHALHSKSLRINSAGLLHSTYDCYNLISLVCYLLSGAFFAWF